MTFPGHTALWHRGCVLRRLRASPIAPALPKLRRTSSALTCNEKMPPKTPPSPLKGAPAAPLSPRASQQGWLWVTSSGTGSPLSTCSPDFLLWEHFFLDSQAYLMTASPPLAESPALLQPPAFFFPVESRLNPTATS